jgi:hypothetical protein
MLKKLNTAFLSLYFSGRFDRVAATYVAPISPLLGGRGKWGRERQAGHYVWSSVKLKKTRVSRGSSIACLITASTSMGYRLLGDYY